MAFLLLLSASAQSQPISAPWTLTVGGVDVSASVINGGRFVEKASSTDGIGAFTVNGSHDAIVVGADVLLSVNGTALWEGTVTTATPQYDSQGGQIATMVLSAPLAAQLDVATHYVVTQPTDVASIAQALCSQTPVPFGSQTSLGSSGGTLSIQNVAKGLSVAALVARKDWRVQNGSVAFVGPDSFSMLSDRISGLTTSGSSVVVLGGLDSQTKQPLKDSYPTLSTGTVLQASHPEISDPATLAAAGAALAQRYGQNAVTATVPLPAGTIVRAGDWFMDPDGNAIVAHQVEHKLVAGLTVPTVNLGYPQLPQASPVPDTTAQRSAHYPSARLANDFLVSGASFTASGLRVTFSDAQIVLAGAPHSISGATLTLDANATALVTASGSGYAFADSTALPAPGVAVPLFVITTDDANVIGSEDVAPRGGIGNYHLMPANPNNAPVVSVGTITLAAEGTTSAKATVPFSVTGLTLDETIGSIEVVQSFAGENQWGNSHVLQWSPGVLSFTDYRHGLSAAQGYDLAVNILGRDGKPLNASPLIIGTSPTISSSQIAIALDLDQVNDGRTYIRMPGANMDSNRRGLIDFTQIGHIGKSLANVPDDSTSQRYAVLSVDANRRAIIDFTQNGHVGKSLANVPDDSGSGRFAVASIDGNRRALIDYSQSGHIGNITWTHQSSEYQLNFDSSGNAKATTMFLESIPNSLSNMLNDISMQWISPTAGALNIWMANAAGTGLPTWTPPNGGAIISPSSSSCGSSSTPLYQFTGLNSSTKYYFVIYYSVTTGTFQNYTTAYSSAPTNAQIATALADGTILAVVASASSSSGITPSGGGTTGGISGGTGHQRYQ